MTNIGGDILMWRFFVELWLKTLTQSGEEVSLGRLQVHSSLFETLYKFH